MMTDQLDKIVHEVRATIEALQRDLAEIRGEVDAHVANCEQAMFEAYDAVRWNDARREYVTQSARASAINAVLNSAAARLTNIGTQVELAYLRGMVKGIRYDQSIR